MKYLVEAIMLDMNQGEVRKIVEVERSSIEEALKSVYDNYLIIEVLTIRKVEE